jgi:hypothetical protein
MAYTFTQTPPSLSLAESPMVFTVLDTTNVSKDQYQYVLKLKYWTGSFAQEPATFNYVLQKYPNASGRGMFDISKIIGSLFVGAEQDYHQMYNYKVYGNFIYYTASIGGYVTGSDVTSSINQAIDGYQLFNSSSYIGEPANSESALWPIMSSAPTTQSSYICDFCGGTGNYGLMSVLNFYNSSNTASYTAVDFNGVSRSYQETWVSTNVTGSTTASVTQIASGINVLNLLSPGFITSDTAYYTVQIKNNGVSIPSASIRFDVVDECKYTPVVIKFKNQFGQFDYITFPKAHYEDFNVSENTYQPQLGTWESTALNIANYSTLRKRYYVDTEENLEVNTDFIPESYNEWMKQLLVSDEVYWVPNNNTIIPLIIKTKSIRFKTQVNDKLINYTIGFTLGRSYKLIL